ncbi:MAG: uroporphyrinogen-III synthase [Chloroflexota bacterium]
MKVLITRPRLQADSFAAALEGAGFEPVFFPVIEICPFEENVALERAIEKLDCYDWIVFTSVNGVEAFFSYPHPLPLIIPEGDSHWERGAKGGVRVAAIGPKTAAALQTRGVTPDFVPDEYVAEAILPGLGDLRGRWVLLPRAETARKALPDAILEAGGVAHEIAVYRTVPAEPASDGLAALRSGVDAVTFTSPSTVENFVALACQAGLDPLRLPGEPKIACIGPITQQAAEEAGFAGALVAKEYTTEGLVDLLRNANFIPEE